MLKKALDALIQRSLIWMLWSNMRRRAIIALHRWCTGSVIMHWYWCVLHLKCKDQLILGGAERDAESCGSTCVLSSPCEHFSGTLFCQVPGV